MKKWIFSSLSMICLLVALMGTSCNFTPSADTVTAVKQEQSLQNAVEQIGIPATPNHTELKQLKDIYELRDNPKLIHYAYVQSAMSGKFIYLGKCIGYGIPYATQFSSPQKDIFQTTASSIHFQMPQAEPNGLFMPSDARGTWVMLLDPNDSTAAAQPVYIEGDVAVSPFKLPNSVMQ